MARSLFAAVALLSLIPVVSPALHAQAAGGAHYAVPRTPWGDPDFQGLWPANDMQGTPYERPAELGTRATLTEAELAARQQTRQRQAAADSEQFAQPGAPPASAARRTGPRANAAIRHGRRRSWWSRPTAAFRR